MGLKEPESVSCIACIKPYYFDVADDRVCYVKKNFLSKVISVGQENRLDVTNPHAERFFLIRKIVPLWGFGTGYDGP